MKRAEIMEARVGDVHAVLRRERLLDECTCDRTELDWPEGVCFHCQLVAGRRALSQALVWAIREARRDENNGAGRDGSGAGAGERTQGIPAYAGTGPGVPFVAALRTFGLVDTAEVVEEEGEWDEQDV